MKACFSPRVLVILLAAVASLTPFATDTYLPAMPVMAIWFGTHNGMVEMTLGFFFLGYAMGQLIGGPLSDHYGRRMIGGPGVIIFLLATVAIIRAPNIEIVILARFVQAVGCGLITVIAPAVIRDSFSGKESARMFALIIAVMMLTRLIAPALGVVLLNFFDWRMIFVFLAGYAMVSLSIILLCLPERKQPLTERLSMAKVWNGYRRVLTNRRSVGYMITQAFSIGVMYIFITGSAFAYITYYGISTDMFPLLLGANIIILIIFNRLNPLLLKTFSPHQLIGAGITIQILASAALWSVQFIDPHHTYHNIYLVVPIIMLAIGASGIITPNSFACFLEDFGDSSGSATATIVTCQFVIGAILSAILGMLHSDTIGPMTTLMLLSSIISVLSYRLLTHRN